MAINDDLFPLALRVRAVLERDLDDGWSDAQPPPALAHYTSLENLESIVASRQIWLSSPLLMNDHDEVSWGIDATSSILRNDRSLPGLLTKTRFDTLLREFERLREEFTRTDLPDTYVFCLSEHSAEQGDGLLSMWRGYGHDGKGVALILDVSGLSFLSETPLILAKVNYLSDFERRSWISRTLLEFCRNEAALLLIDRDASLAAKELFDRILIASIYSKHQGFKEEREWRVCYLPDRDTKGLLKRNLHYLNNARGIEPKLKLHLGIDPGVSGDLSLEKIVKQIILGPSPTSPLVEHAVKRMLQHNDAVALISKITSSAIPYRSRS